MNALFAAGLEFQQYLQEQRWQFCFIGGVATLRWGRARMTQDVDLTILTGYGAEEVYVERIISHFSSRIPDPKDFALDHRVLLLTASNGVAVDVTLAALPFEEQMIKRATAFSYDQDCSLHTCSAEDLIVLKATANRDVDWMDIDGILHRQTEYLDRDYILAQLSPICEVKEAPEILERLRELMGRF